MELKLHAQFTDIPASAWNELAKDGISDTPFARHEYLHQWWSTHGGGEWENGDLVLVTGVQDGRLRAIAPLFIAPIDGQKSLLLVGSIEISDYLDLIAQPGDVRTFVRELLSFCAATPHLSGLPLDFFNVPEASPTLAALREAAETLGWTYHEEIFRPTPRVALNGDFEAYLTRLDKKQRHEIRRKLRRASEGPMPAELELVSDATALEKGIEDFLDLMGHDPEKARFLTPTMRSQMQAFMRIAWEGRYLWLAFLSIGGARAAGAFNFDYRNRLWGYNSAVNREFAALSPGWVLLALQLRWACEQGRDEFDFMRGDEDYKYRFGAVNRHVMRARVVPA